MCVDIKPFAELLELFLSLFDAALVQPIWLMYICLSWMFYLGDAITITYSLPRLTSPRERLEWYDCPRHRDAGLRLNFLLFLLIEN